jgi:uncharacterized phage protein (TIGR02216 family)
MTPLPLAGGAGGGPVSHNDSPSPNPSRTREGDLFGSTATKLAAQTALTLGWRPDDFWNATPAELASILAVLLGDSAAADAQTLSNLMEQFPDG